MESGVHHNLLITMHLLGIHSTHGCTDNDIGILFVAQFVEKTQCLFGIQWYVWGYDLSFRKLVPKILCCLCGS